MSKACRDFAWSKSAPAGGAYAARLFADFGADVIKVERLAGIRRAASRR